MENITKQIAATEENVEIAINNIKKFADEKGYRFLDQTFMVNNSLIFESKSKEKVLKNYLWRLDQKITMAQANKFLHYLFRKVYKVEITPRVEYSEKELKIKSARKAWKKVQAEADLLHKAYRDEKGDFYKK